MPGRQDQGAPKRWYHNPAWAAVIVATVGSIVVPLVIRFTDGGDNARGGSSALTTTVITQPVSTSPITIRPTSTSTSVAAASSTITTTATVATTSTAPTLPLTTPTVAPSTVPPVTVIDPPSGSLSPVPGDEAQVAAVEPPVNSDASIDGVGAGCMYAVSPPGWVYLKLKESTRISAVEIAFSDDVAAGYSFAVGVPPEAVQIQVTVKVGAYKYRTFDLPAPVESNLVAIQSLVAICHIRFA